MMLNISAYEAVLYTIIVSLPQLFILLGTSLLWDKIGRKLLLLVSLVVSFISLLLLGIAFWMEQTNKIPLPHNLIPKSSTFIFVLVTLLLARCGFAIGLGPITQIMTPELLPISIRARGLSISLGVYWGTGLIFTAVFPTLMQVIPAASIFWFLSAVMILGFIFVLLTVKEKKSESMNDIECLHQLPILSPGASNRELLPKDSLVAQLRPVIIPLPPPSPILPLCHI